MHVSKLVIINKQDAYKNKFEKEVCSNHNKSKETNT